MRGLPYEPVRDAETGAPRKEESQTPPEPEHPSRCAPETLGPSNVGALRMRMDFSGMFCDLVVAELEP